MTNSEYLRELKDRYDIAYWLMPRQLRSDMFWLIYELELAHGIREIVDE